jgi:hypothetical protein
VCTAYATPPNYRFCIPICIPVGLEFKACMQRAACRYNVKLSDPKRLKMCRGFVQTQERATERSDYRRQQAQSRRDARMASLGATDVVAPKASPCTLEELQDKRRAAWKASYVMSLRGQGLAELPDLQVEWEHLGPDTVAKLRAIDVGNNALTSLSGVCTFLLIIMRTQYGDPLGLCILAPFRCFPYPKICLCAQAIAIVPSNPTVCELVH